MAYDVNQSKTALEAGPVNVVLWLLQHTDGVYWDENNFSYREWVKQYVDSIICDWSVGEQFAPMMPQVGAGGGEITGVYNNGFNNGLIIGLRIKRK